MTASELYKIVEGVPREAWPKGLGYSESAFPEPVWVGRDVTEESVSFITTDFAYDAFVGSMVSWLIAQNRYVDMSRFGNDENYEVSMWKHPAIGPSILEALAAACKQIGTK